ncbi:peptidylprolyl isomerase [candidate division KSB1 bacterium]
MKKMIYLILTLGLILSCGEKEDPPWKKVLTDAEITEINNNLKNLDEQEVLPGEIGIIETEFGTIKIKFFINVAPGHCNNFKKLANSGYYDGILFHRVMKGFMLQAGDILSRDNNPKNDGTGGPGYTIRAEFSNLNHKRGIVSMARKGYNENTAGSQFFILHQDALYLDGDYTVFGEVFEGLGVVDKIAEVPVRGENPINKIYMKKVRVVKE